MLRRCGTKHLLTLVAVASIVGYACADRHIADLVQDGIKNSVLSDSAAPPPIKPIRWTAAQVPKERDEIDNELHHSPSVAFGDKVWNVKYNKLWESGQKIGETIVGLKLDQDMKPVKKWDGAAYTNDLDIDQNPDYNSIMEIDGRIFGISQFETRPGGVFLFEYSMINGELEVIRAEPVDLSAVHGIWVPCAGSVTPWNTHLGSEEYEPNAEDQTGADLATPASTYTIPMARFIGAYLPMDGSATNQDLTDAGFQPYWYGFPWEAKIVDGVAHVVKHYAMGRQASELSYVMPDKKTVYTTDDGTNRYFQKFVADHPGDLSEGTLYCSKFTQTTADGLYPHDSEWNIEWIEMGHSNDNTLHAAIEGLTFDKIFTQEAPVNGACPTSGFTAVNTDSSSSGRGLECLQINAGFELHAAFFETRRAAAMMGCTTEWNKWEGITFSPSHHRIYTALSSVERGTRDGDSRYDEGGPNHVRIADNVCGCVMYLDVDEHYSATHMGSLVCGSLMDQYNGDGNSCQVDSISNPDNVAMIEPYNQLIIGEDTGRHENNMVWVYDFYSMSLQRVFLTPSGAETTSPYFYQIRGNDLISVVGQHPSNMPAFFGVMQFAGKKGHEHPNWEGIEMARGEDKEKVLHSERLVLENVERFLHYDVWARTGQSFGQHKVGRVVDKDMNIVYKRAADGSKSDEEEISNNPDYMSIMEVDGRIFSMIHFESPRPGVIYLLEFKQHDDGRLETIRAEPVDASNVGGIWIPCAGSMTPWNTHFGSEEYEPNARPIHDPTNQGGDGVRAATGFERYFGVYGEATIAEVRAAGFNPYRYGYVWEGKVVGGTGHITKRYAIGRRANELGIVMPDAKTVYVTDDGTNVVFQKFVADRVNDLSAGTLSCAIMHQFKNYSTPAYDAWWNIEWITMAHATDAEVDAAIETTSFFDIFEVMDWATCDTSSGFKSINVGGIGAECLKLKPGMEMLASTLESRRYAAMLGCTAEASKWEGITFSPKRMQIYTAMSQIKYGMEDNKRWGSADTRYDEGGPNHMKVEANKCGCIYAMDVDENFSVSNMHPLVCGAPLDSDDENNNGCDPNHIAEPDNCAMIDEFDQLIIGEDTGEHWNDVIWVYDFHTKGLTRIFSTPTAAETTSPYWHHDINGFNYITAVVQHPRSSLTGTAGWMGAMRIGEPTGRQFSRLSLEGIPMPTGDEKLEAQSSPSALIHDTVNYDTHVKKIWYAGQKIGNTIVGLKYDKDMKPVQTWDGATYTNALDISMDPDYVSIMEHEDGRIWSIAHFETRPAGLYLFELGMFNGELEVISASPIDLSAVHGIWVPCAGSVTPWNTHLGSEEYEPNAKHQTGAYLATPASTYTIPMARFIGAYLPMDGSATNQDLTDAGFQPYWYGFPWEAKIVDGVAHVVKHYAMGRQASELSYVMPDKKTVYTTDDGTNRYFQKFVADHPGDLSEGTLYCSKFTQTTADGLYPHDSEWNIEWIEMGAASNELLAGEIEGLTFDKIFAEAAPVDGSCPVGFTSINTDSSSADRGHECLQINAGFELHAAFFETRRAAAMMGCTTEWNKWEGITFSPSHHRIYTALSSVERGTRDGDSRYDEGGPNHVRIADNVCGCVMYLDVDEHYSATHMGSLVCGVPQNDDLLGAGSNQRGNRCNPDAIANPDNVAMVEKYNQLIIGEDSGRHENNMVWVYDVYSMSLSRVFTVPLGAETTSPYFHENIGGNDWITVVGQHPDAPVDPFFGLIKVSANKGKHDSPVWKGIPMATGDEKLTTQTTDTAVFGNFKEHVPFQKLITVGDSVGSKHKFGYTLDMNMNQIYQQNGDGSANNNEEFSDNPDYMSIMEVDGRIFSMVHFESPRPGMVYLLELTQSDGQLKVIRMEPVDASNVGGIWIPCAGSMTPWNTHFGSEEYEPNARYFFDPQFNTSLADSSVRSFTRYFGHYGRPTNLEAAGVGFNPYRYGYVWEGSITSAGKGHIAKRYAIGRRANELGIVMPDAKTVYVTDDGTNVVFQKFVADRVNDLSAGTLYCANMTQDQDDVPPAWVASWSIEWITMAHATDAEVDAAIETTSFFDIFEVMDWATCDTSSGFKSINVGGIGAECLKLKPGMEMLASTLESRRYAAMLGCTAEASKWEGITFSPKRMQIYTAMSQIKYGMEDNKRWGSADTRYDEGGPNHMKVEANKCGCIYAMDVDENFVVKNMHPLVCGNPMDMDDANNNGCDPNHIAEPDNCAMMEPYDQLLIGEDTGEHYNDVIWVYDFASQGLTRILSAPAGAETTSPYFHRNINGHSYVSSVIQHPGSAEEPLGSVGVFGPFAATKTAPRPSTATPITMELLSRTKMPGAYDTADGAFSSDPDDWMFAPDGLDYKFEWAGVEKVWAADHVVYALGQNKIVNMLDVSDPSDPMLVGSIRLEHAGTDIATCGDKLMIATEGATKQSPGNVYIHTILGRGRVSENSIKVSTIGALPDQCTWTKDCGMIVCAIEGEGAGKIVGSRAVIDNPEGGVTIIEMGDRAPEAIFLSFKDFGVNDPMMTKKLLADGVRWSLSPDTMQWIMNDNDGQLMANGENLTNGYTLDLDPDQATFSRDMEPEYVAISKDGKTAWVSLQENCAFAIVDLEQKRITDIKGMGFKEWKHTRNGLDPNDDDGLLELSMWDIKGMYMPDTIKSYVAANGREYIVTANEGDAKEYFFGDDGDHLWGEEFRGKDLDKVFAESAGLDADFILDTGIDAATMESGVLARLKFGTFDGLYDMQANGSVPASKMYKDLYTFGGRSFSIIDAETFEVVYDSGSLIEQIHYEFYKTIFNAEADGDEDGTMSMFDSVDSRSDAKGPEPESVAIGSVCGKTVAFIGNERTATIFAFDVTNPNAVKLESHISVAGNPMLSAKDAFLAGGEMLGDWDPEGMTFDPETKTLVVGGAISGTVSVFQTFGWPTCEDELFGQEVCDPGCFKHMIDNGVCNPMCLTSMCNYDGKDCDEGYMPGMMGMKFGSLASVVDAIAGANGLPSPYMFYDKAAEIVIGADGDMNGYLDKDEAMAMGLGEDEIVAIAMGGDMITVQHVVDILAMLPMAVGSAARYYSEHEEVPPMLDSLLLRFVGGDARSAMVSGPFEDLLKMADMNMDDVVSRDELFETRMMAMTTDASCGPGGFSLVSGSVDANVAVPATGSHAVKCTWVVLPPIHYAAMEEMEMRSKTSKKTAGMPQTKGNRKKTLGTAAKKVRGAAAGKQTTLPLTDVTKTASKKIKSTRKQAMEARTKKTLAPRLPASLRNSHGAAETSPIVTLQRTVAGGLFDATTFHTFCGGVLIGPDVVLTAAQCVKEGEMMSEMHQQQVLVGSAKRGVRSVIAHPDISVDVAILILDATVLVMPVKLHGMSGNIEDEEMACKMEEHLVFDGWDQVLPLDSDTCNTFYHEITGVHDLVTGEQICAFSTANGIMMNPNTRSVPGMEYAGVLPDWLFSCPADRMAVNALPGDAMFYEEDGRITLVGILHHYTSPVCQNVLGAGLPTIFTAIDKMVLQWIFATAPGAGMHVTTPIEVTLEDMSLPRGAFLTVYTGAPSPMNLRGNISSISCGENRIFEDVGKGVMTLVLDVPAHTTPAHGDGFAVDVEVKRNSIMSKCTVDISISDVMELRSEGNAMTGGLIKSGPGPYSMWMCARAWDMEEQFDCGFGPMEWACFRFHDKSKEFKFWGPNSELQLVKGDKSDFDEGLEQLQMMWLEGQSHQDAELEVDGGYSALPSSSPVGGAVGGGSTY